jgi:hypothetical protein
MTVEFSLNGYGQLLDHLAAHGYEMIRFEELRMLPQGADRCLLRHDVDVSTDFAVRMAEFEAARQVRSTYFVMLRSPLYNALSRACTDDLRRIVSLGHEVGLHFDAAYDPAPAVPVETRITRELAVLADMTGAPASAFSFHQPSAEILTGTIVVPGATNAYTLDRDGWDYISDSNRDWRGRDVFGIISRRRPLQILLHPLWWVCDSPEILDCWDHAIGRNFERQQRQLLATERAYGPARSIELKRDRAGK